MLRSTLTEQESRNCGNLICSSVQQVLLDKMIIHDPSGLPCDTGAQESYSLRSYHTFSMKM